jgi:hypothetical protein
MKGRKWMYVYRIAETSFFAKDETGRKYCGVIYY